MPLSVLLNRPITIIRRTDSGTIDESGDAVMSEATEVVMGELQQVRRNEPGAAGELSITDWLLILPAGTDIRTGDAVQTDDGIYEVVGDPWPARNPRTQAASHVEASVKRTAGAEDV